FSVIAGQATAAWELIEEVNDLDYLFAPVGGGGLLSGTLLAAQYYSPATRVIGGEPHGADDAYRSLRSGKVEASQAASIADGLLSSLGDKTFPIIQEFVTDIVTVTDLEIIAAMKLIWEELRGIAEPSGAVPLAALLKEKEKLSGKKAGIIISGGNVDLDRAFSLCSRVSRVWLDRCPVCSASFLNLSTFGGARFGKTLLRMFTSPSFSSASTARACSSLFLPTTLVTCSSFWRHTSAGMVSVSFVPS